MSKYSLLAVCAGALSACTLTINGSGSEGNTSTHQTSQTNGATTDDPGFTSGTSEPPVTGTGEPVPTTGVPTTDEPSTGPVIGSSTAGDSTAGDSTAGDTSGGSTGDTGTDGSSTADTTTGSGYGLCGWNAGQTYYACPDDGGVAGLEDPKGNYEIDCRDQELVAGEPCGAVGPAGCCRPDGHLFYCNEGTLVEQECTE